MAKQEHYIDIRLTATIETEDLGNGDTYTAIMSLDADVLKTKGITPAMLYSLYESMGQSDKWQLWLQDELPWALYSHAQDTED